VVVVPPSPAPEDCVVEIADLRESHAGLRLLDEVSIREMRESLVRHGQLMALAVYRPHEGNGTRTLEVVDGFKRLRAARELGWARLRVRVLAVDVAEAKAAIGILNHGHGLSEIEEAWLVRSLHREEALTQPQIGRLLGRHKSWVSRRLLLAEGLDEHVQADVRLGLLAASTAAAVARLPRCNQRTAAEAVMNRGLTKHQTERLVAEVLARAPAEREAALAEALARVPEIGPPASGRLRQPERTPAQWLVADVGAVTRICARLQARLWERPLAALGKPAAQLVADGLVALAPVLAALVRTIERVVAGDHGVKAHVDNARRA
jgi:ParB/RepB/Spo0J family partition protein